MRYTPRSRDRYKSLVALTTGVVALGSFAATGVATGLAAKQTTERDAARADAEATAAALARAAAARARQPLPWSPQITVVKHRPSRTVVRTHVVHQVSSVGVAAPASGGSVGYSAPVQSAPSTSSGGGGASTTFSAPPPPPPPPAPAPAPAPSSGS